MNTTTEHATEHDHADAHDHAMTDAKYIRIALILAAITALEVSTYYVDFGPLFLPSLLIMMVISCLVT